MTFENIPKSEMKNLELLINDWLPDNFVLAGLAVADTEHGEAFYQPTQMMKLGSIIEADYAQDICRDAHEHYETSVQTFVLGGA